MSSRTVLGAGVAALAAVAVLAGSSAAPASATGSATSGSSATAPSATPAGPPSLVAGPPITRQPATWPVDDLTGPVLDLVFGEASADGAVQDQGGTQYRLAADVLFAFDSAKLTARARHELDGIAVKLAAGDPTRVTVTGYTDSVGASGYNLALSRRRADAVRAYLGPRLTGVTVTAAGRGEASPIADNRTKQGQALNRRVEIDVR